MYILIVVLILNGQMVALTYNDQETHRAVRFQTETECYYEYVQHYPLWHAQYGGTLRPKCVPDGVRHDI